MKRAYPQEAVDKCRETKDILGTQRGPHESPVSEPVIVLFNQLAYQWERQQYNEVIERLMREKPQRKQIAFTQFLKTPLTEIIALRAANILESHGYLIVDDVLGVKPETLLGLTQFGPAYLRALQVAIRKLRESVIG